MRNFLKKSAILGLVSIAASLLAVGANKQWEAAEYIMQQISTPSNPSSGKVKLYTKSGSSVYWLNSSGTEKQINRATDLTGITPVANGGTNASSFAASGPAYYNGSSLVSETLLALTRGGTNKSLTPVAGGVCYTDADSFEVTSAGSTGSLLQSNGTSAPSFTTATYPGSTSINRILYSSSNDVVDQITSGARGALVTDSSSVPSIATSSADDEVLRRSGGVVGFGAVNLGNSTSAVSGILNPYNGGTGYSSFTNGEFLIGKANGTLNKTTITGGSGITVTNGDGTVTIASTGGGAGASYSSSSAISNVGMSTSVSSNAITIALKQSDGSTNCDSTTPCSISFRSSAGTTGQYVTRSVTSALTLVVSSGSTLGHQSGVTQAAYVYALDNAGTVELAVSGSFLGDEGSLTTTLAEGGAGAADGYSAMYSTTARTNVAFRLIGRFVSNEATAGTWATNSSEISVTPFKSGEVRTDAMTGAGIYWISFGGASERSQCTSSPCTIYAQSGNWVTSVTRNGTGDYTLNIVSGICTRAPVCWGMDAQGSGNTSFPMTTGAAPTTTAYRFAFTNYNVPGNRDTQVDMGCICPR